MDRLKALDQQPETATKSTSERFTFLAEQTGGSSSAGRKMASLLVAKKDEDLRMRDPEAYLRWLAGKYNDPLSDVNAQAVIREAQKELPKLLHALCPATATPSTGANSRRVRSADRPQPVPYRQGSTVGVERYHPDDDDNQVRQRQFPGRQLSARISVALPVRTGAIAQTAQSRKEIRMAAMREFMSTDGAMAMQQAADDAADRSASGFVSMYSVKPKGRRGRQLPAVQLPAARQLVQGKLNAKALRSGASSRDVVSGYAVSHTALGESEDDSDDGHRQPIASSSVASRSAASQPLPQLPRGGAKLWLRTPSITGAGLIGWPIMALFCEYEGQSYSEQTWHDGVVVAYDDTHDNPYIAFFESDSVWERMDFPDDTVIFRKGDASDVCLCVTEDMLPDEGDDAL